MSEINYKFSYPISKINYIFLHYNENLKKSINPI